jgi:hypothetical protein
MMGDGVSRRRFLGSLGALLVSGSVGTTRVMATGRTGRAWSLDDFARNIQSGGPPKDGIPPIDRPRYVAASEAGRFLDADDVVFGFERAGVVKAYPQKILVWHEIVNEEVGGEPVSITYCPLTGSTVAFRGRGTTVAGATLTFGTTGKLVNSNLLMYDRPTDSEWPQVLGTAITGRRRSQVLEEWPTVWTTFGRWRRRHPDTLVLSTDTGFFRAYGTDPYGSYARTGTYYDSGEPFFPVMASDRRFPAKHVVVGVKTDAGRLAIPKAAAVRARAVNTGLGETPVGALYDAELDAVRVFSRSLAGRVLTFQVDGEAYADEATGGRWTAAGRCETGPLCGAELRPLPAFDVMWFAWYAFYPDTAVWSSGG